MGRFLGRVREKARRINGAGWGVEMSEAAVR